MPTTDPTDAPLESLSAEWLTMPDLAERLGMRLQDARRLLEDRDLVACRIGERGVLAVPAEFLAPEPDLHGRIPDTPAAGERPVPLAALRGTITVFGDAGLRDEEIVRWLLTPDATLPAGPHPAAAIRAGFKTEVRRRAMESAW